MSGSRPLSELIVELLNDAGNWIDRYRDNLLGIFTLIAGVITVLDRVFGVSFIPVGDAFIGVLTSNSFISVLIVFVLISQVVVYRKVAWIVYQIEPSERTDDEEGSVVTDGSGLPPRDSKGRFKSSSGGGSNIILLLLGAIGGYIVGVE